jgi:hypothetical protein
MRLTSRPTTVIIDLYDTSAKCGYPTVVQLEFSL